MIVDVLLQIQKKSENIHLEVYHSPDKMFRTSELL